MYADDTYMHVHDVHVHVLCTCTCIRIHLESIILKHPQLDYQQCKLHVRSYSYIGQLNRLSSPITYLVILDDNDVYI